jgi:hypothetical protein
LNRTKITLATLSVAAVLVAACGGSTGSSPAAGTEAPAATTAPAATEAPAATDAGTGEKPTLTFIAQIDNPSQAFSWKMYQKNAEKYGWNVAVCDNKGDVHLHQRRRCAGHQRHRHQPGRRGRLRPGHQGRDGCGRRGLPEHGPGGG